MILLHIRKIIDKFIRRGNSIGTAFQSHKRTSNLKWWKWSLSCMKIKIWMCCMLQNSFHTSIYNKSLLEEKKLIEGIKMIQTYQWSICSSNSIEANPSFRVKVCILHCRTVSALVVKALERKLGLFNIFFIDIGIRIFLKQWKQWTVWGMRTVLTSGASKMESSNLQQVHIVAVFL